MLSVVNVKDFFSKSEQFRRKLDLFIFTKEFLTKKFIFLCSVFASFAMPQKCYKVVSEVYPKLPQNSQMACFATIVNGV